VTVRQKTNGAHKSLFALRPVLVSDRDVLDDQAFHRMISLERKRTERSGKPFLLMLVDTGTEQLANRDGRALKDLVAALVRTTRETDVLGWYRTDSVFGVMFTEIASEERSTILSTMLVRVSSTLRSQLPVEQFNKISISFHMFPEEWDVTSTQRPTNPTLYPDLVKRDESRKFFAVVKRVMDILGSLVALLLLSPLFLVLSAAIKLTSRGPVFFTQQRVGQYGVPFTFLKFRSMYINNDASQHKEYVRNLIAGAAERKLSAVNGDAVYKLVDDPRITGVGAFLRRTSLDELPQFLNVLAGQMSLVGPRPPIAYEVEAYDLWHRRRLLEAKPGITGLWQVNGRNRVEFDEMVRLDLTYAQTWSPWLDLQILWRTPRAVVDGAH
jgi:lipopolysaccharide/colanic/teichoic acid biosynthesis glycosyltransferase